MTTLHRTALCVWLVAFTGFPSRAATVVRVSPGGDDRAAGTEAAPVRNIAIAVQRSRGQPRPATIILATGRYPLASTLDLDTDDSGLEIRADAGAHPVLSGGTQLTGWTQDPTRPGVWQVTIPSVREGTWYFQELFVNGVRAQRARTPNTGFLRARGPLGGDATITLPFQPGDLRSEWANLPEARLVMLQKWTDLHVPIRAIDAQRNVAELPGGPRPDWMTEADARYWIENVPDALDVPGEWYLDRKSGVLSLIPPTGMDPNRVPVVAPQLKVLLGVRGDEAGRRPVTGIQLRGLTFADTDYDMPAGGLISPQAAVPVRGAVRVEFATDGTIEDCLLENIGGYAVDLGRGAQRWRIRNNEVRGAGGGGIRLGEPGDRQPDAFSACREHEVTDNQLHELGRVFSPAVGIILFQSGGNHIAHNDIYDLFYTAISVGWNWGYQETPCRDNIIEYNHLHDIGQGRLSDMGGVYTLGIQPGTVIRNNLIHDVTSYDYGGWGLYTDEGSTGILLENNVVFRCKSAGFHQHYGRENVVRNNVFALNREFELMRSREEDHISFFFTNNIVYFDSGKLLGSTWRNDHFVMDRNLYYDVRVGPKPDRMEFAGATWDQWHSRGHDTNSVIADPLLMAPDQGDFRLRPGSPAWKLGFRAIDLTTVGPRTKGASR